MNAREVVLRLPELLSCVFEHADPPTQAASTQVCHNWEVPAVNALWYRLDAPHRLFSLLGRISDTIDSTGWTFSEPINPKAWPRFAHYARRVRFLDLWDSPNIIYTGMLYPALMAAALQNPPHNGPLFPSLHTLIVHYGNLSPERLQPILLLMSPSLQRLDISLPDVHGWGHFGKFMLDVVSSVHHLKTFFIEVQGDFSTISSRDTTMIEEGLAALIQANSALWRIDMPTVFSMRESVWAAISQLQNCEYLDRLDGMAPPEFVDGQDAVPIFLPDTFRCIRHLSMELRYIGSSLFSRHVPPSLREVDLTIIGLDGPQLIRDLSHGGSQLHSLIINFEEEDPIEMDDIRPILSLMHLSEISLTFGQTPLLEDADVAALAAALPQLTKLGIVFDPSSDQRTSLGRFSLNALLPIAQHCRELSELDICVASTPPPPSTLIPPDHCFSKLKSINFGASLPPDPWATTLFLSMVCGDQVNFFSEPLWFQYVGREKAETFWDKVNAAFVQVCAHNALLRGAQVAWGR